MTDFCLSIAGITINVKGIAYDYFSYRMRNYICESIENPDVKIVYKEEGKIDIPDHKIIKKDGYRVFGETDEEYINYDVLNDGSYSALMKISKDGRDVSCSLFDVEDLGGASLSIRSFNMIGEALKYIVTAHNGLCIHSSSLSYNNNGVIFSAPSGTGKSTHTRLWQKVFKNVEIINDDMPVLRLIDNVWHLCGSPWSGKTEINVNKRVPLKGVVFLERGEINEISEIKVPESVLKILGQTVMPPYKEGAAKLMGCISSLVTTVPVFKLRCNISDDAPKVVAKKLGVI